MRDQDPGKKKQKIKEGRNKKERHRTSLAWCVKKRAAVGLAFLDESFCLLASKNEFRFYLNRILFFFFLFFLYKCVEHIIIENTTDCLRFEGKSSSLTGGDWSVSERKPGHPARRSEEIKQQQRKTCSVGRKEEIGKI